MKFILIILLASSGGYSHGNPSVSQQEYDSVIACAKAGDAVSNAVKTMISDKPQVAVVCTPKGDE